jgi:hypothetical protein
MREKGVSGDGFQIQADLGGGGEAGRRVSKC